MLDKVHKSTYIFISFMLFAATVCMVAAFAFTAINCWRPVSFYPPTLPIADSNPWNHEGPDGLQEVFPDEVVPTDQSSFVITTTVDYNTFDGEYILFNNLRQAVEVSANGSVLYEMGTGDRKTKLSAKGYNVVKLPEQEEPYILEISFSQLGNSSCSIPEFYFAHIDEIIMFLLAKDSVVLVLSCIWILLAVFLFVIFVAFSANRIIDYRVFCLLLLLIIIILRNIADSSISCLIPLDKEIISTVDYYMLTIMPIPILYYILYSCFEYKAPGFKAMLVLIIANIIVQSVLYIGNIASLHNMLIFSQALVFSTLIYGMFCTIYDWYKHRSRARIMQTAGFVVTALVGIVTVMVYWQGVSLLYQVMFQLTILAFFFSSLFVVIFSSLQEGYQLKVVNAENDMDRLGDVDQLTGLSNRRGFDKKLNEIFTKFAGHANALLFILDVNGLKYVNDKYGHMAGDELLIAAANVINRAFSQVGTTYRIGGDEFAVVIEDTSVNIGKLYAKMDELIQKHNFEAKVPLSIARGYSPLISPAGEKSSISEWKMNADKNMYKDKVKGRTVIEDDAAREYLEVISSFVGAVDAKDTYTADHSERVAVLSDYICTLIGVSKTSAHQIHIAATLHDIGKIGIPDFILLKDGPLTDTEFEIIQTHPEIGEEIVKHTKAFYEIGQIIRHHHERYDGKGYPDGISGEDIPLGSRIIAIADSIDAMTSDRSYRKGRSMEYCHQEVEDNLGRMYDPVIGSIVLENWDSIESVVHTSNIVVKDN